MRDAELCRHILRLEALWTVQSVEWHAQALDSHVVSGTALDMQPQMVSNARSEP
jgi:hypothetical protein